MKTKINFNQLTLPFGQGRTRAISYDTRVRAFWFLAGISVFSLVAYVYAVNATARHVAERAALEGKSTELVTELAQLEFQYIDMTNAITMDTAHQYGFVEDEQPLYVTRKGSDSLSFNTEKP